MRSKEWRQDNPGYADFRVISIKYDPLYIAYFPGQRINKPNRDEQDNPG